MKTSEKRALEIMRCFVKQYPDTNKKYKRLMRGRIRFPESIYVWESILRDVGFIINLSRGVK